MHSVTAPFQDFSAKPQGRYLAFQTTRCRTKQQYNEAANVFDITDIRYNQHRLYRESNKSEYLSRTTVHSKPHFVVTDTASVIKFKVLVLAEDVLFVMEQEQLISTFTSLYTIICNIGVCYTEVRQHVHDHARCVVPWDNTALSSKGLEAFFLHKQTRSRNNTALSGDG